jgi:hypothetical protein
MFDGIELGIEFFEGLLAIDEAIVERAAREPCRECGGPLHRGDHLRKPRGGLLAIAGEAFIVSYVPHGAEIQTGTFLLVFKERSGLENAVFDATDGQVETEARPAQLDWVRADLGGRVTLLAPKQFDPARAQLRLVTESMVYELEALREQGTPVWDIAVCRKMVPRSERLAHVGNAEHELEAPIEVARGFRAARELRARLGAGVLDWSAFAQRHAEPASGRPATVRRALLLVQLVEAVVKALEIYPVDVVRTERRDGACIVTLRARAETDRDRFAARVGLGAA